MSYDCAETPETRISRIMTEFNFKSDAQRYFTAEMVQIISNAVLEEREANARIAEVIDVEIARRIRQRSSQCETDTLQRE